MAKVYVSSTIADLEAERQAVIDWLVAAQHQVVHSYRPSSDTVREGCLADVDACDVYVLILGHRTGSSRRITTRRGCRSPTWSSAGPSSLASRGLCCCVPAFPMSASLMWLIR